MATITEALPLSIACILSYRQFTDPNGRTAINERTVERLSQGGRALLSFGPCRTPRSCARPSRCDECGPLSPARSACPLYERLGRMGDHGDFGLYARRRAAAPCCAAVGRRRFVLDQHDQQACERLGIDRNASNLSWRAALAAAKEPPSWRTADAARAAGADGIIDRSRSIPGGWHLNLFHWNALGGPSVEVSGDPVEIALSEDGPKWGL